MVVVSQPLRDGYNTLIITIQYRNGINYPWRYRDETFSYIARTFSSQNEEFVYVMCDQVRSNTEYEENHLKHVHSCVHLYTD